MLSLEKVSSSKSPSSHVLEFCEYTVGKANFQGCPGQCYTVATWLCQFMISLRSIHATTAVLEGMDLVMKIESYGSPSGTPKKKVVIKDSGELSKSTSQF